MIACAPRPTWAGDLYREADFDRDGLPDVVRIHNGPSARGLVVWLSKSKSVFLLRTRLPIHRVAAADIDGDGRLDLVAADSSATLHVWKRSAKDRLVRLRPRGGRTTAGPQRRGGVRGSPDTAPLTAETTSNDPPFVVSRPHVAGMSGFSLLRRSSLSRPAAVAPGPRQSRGPPASS